MPEEQAFLTVLLKIVAMFLVILVGWVARRKDYLSRETTGTLSRFVVGITMPAMIFTSMLRTVDPPAIMERWYLPLIGAVIFLVGQVIGLLTLPLFTKRAEQSTFIFLVAVSNWVYLPLPIVISLYGDPGVRDLLLMNIGSVLVLWTLGVWTLQGGKFDQKSLRDLVTNPGLQASFAGIAIALLVPATHTLEQASAGASSLPVMAGSALVQAMVMVGSLTIPLSLIVTGAQLGELDLSDHRPSRALTGVLAARLALTPVAFVALVVAVAQFGYIIPEIPRMIGYLIAAMPVAVSCSIFTERFDGDTSLAARAIFYTTLLSIATVPVILLVISRLHI